MGLRLYAPAVALIVLLGAGAGSASAAIGCGDVITEDTKLKKDIACELGETGLEIDGDGITLNLDGHTIQGDDADNAMVAVSTSGDEDVVVRNGTLRGFGRSLVASGGAGLLVDRLNIRRQENTPIQLTAYNGAKVKRSRIKGNGIAGVLVDGSEGVTVNGNKLTKAGIEFMSGSDHTAAENSITKTGGFALSARPGIAFVGVEGGLARGNQVAETMQAGIAVSGGHDIDVIGNDVRDSELSNISVQGGAVATLVEKNETHGGFFGISADDNALALIRRNTVLEAINDGIRNVEETNPVIRNTANRNGDYGIDSASGALSRDNVAKNNVSPDQCFPSSACNQ